MDGTLFAATVMPAIGLLILARGVHAWIKGRITLKLGYVAEGGLAKAMAALFIGVGAFVTVISIVTVVTNLT